MDEAIGFCFFSDRVLQRPPEAIESDLGDVAIAQHNACTKGQRIGTEEMNVNIARLAVACELEMMMFEIRKTVAHILVTASNRLMPDRLSCAFDANLAANIVEGTVDHQLRSQAAGS